MVDYAAVGTGPGPRTFLPDGACDTHVHVYGPGYPLAPSATRPPPVEATAGVLAALHRRLGVARTLIVQPTAYGFDNAATLDGVRDYGADRARAIVVVPTDVPDAELDALHAAGARGIRVFMLPQPLYAWDDLPGLAARCADRGWTINLQLDGTTLPEHAGRLRDLPCRLVIDHVGKFLSPVDTGHPAFAALQALVDGGRCWVKLSAVYETSATGAPDYADVAELGRALARQAPERMLWASNFPHPGNQDDFPDDVALADTILGWLPDDAARRRALVDNPAELYGF